MDMPRAMRLQPLEGLVFYCIRDKKPATIALHLQLLQVCLEQGVEDDKRTSPPALFSSSFFGLYLRYIFFTLSFIFFILQNVVSTQVPNYVLLLRTEYFSTFFSIIRVSHTHTDNSALKNTFVFQTLGDFRDFIDYFELLKG